MNDFAPDIDDADADLGADYPPQFMEARFASKAPFPWYGGKSQASPLVWQLLGDVDHYCEPFAGSLAVLLNRPHPCNRAYYSETVNDLDALLVNAWRSIQFSPQATAEAASWPVAEADKSARQIALLRWRESEAGERIAGDPAYHDPVMGGWWLWAVAVQIGAFAGDGAWTSDPVTGRIVKQPRGTLREPGVVRNLPFLSVGGRGVYNQTLREPGVRRNLPHLIGSGQGVNGPPLREPGVVRNRPHLSDNGQGVNRQTLREPGVRRNLPHLSSNGQGVNHGALREPGVERNRPEIQAPRGVCHGSLREPGVERKKPHLSNDGRGVNGPPLRERGVCDEAARYHPTTMPKLRAWMALLSARLRHVRILNGDWQRLCTHGAMHTLPVRQGGHVGVFLDPPYAGDVRASGLYAHDHGTLASAVRDWCIANGDDPSNRVVLAGYDSEHPELEAAGWTVHEWFERDSLLAGGMGDQQHRERLWASPHCLRLADAAQMQLAF
jgi:DNA adenine methylase